MLARVILVFVLASFLTGLGVIAWVLTEPRAVHVAARTETVPKAPDASEDHGPRDVEVDDLSAALAKLPSASPGPALEAAPKPQSETASPERDPFEVAPPLLTMPDKPKPLAARADSAPNQPAVISGARSTVQPVSFEEGDPISAMRALHNPALRERAEARLVELGFTASHIALAERFTSADVAQREQAVRALPSTRGIVPRDWFLWASRDSDPVVRKAALSLMITSGERELLARVEELAARDEDPAIREMARAASNRTRERPR